MSDVTLNPLECALDEAQAFREQVKLLQAENAKLRELATLMRTFRHGDCYQCRWLDECRERMEWKCIAPERIDDMARELGVEVGG